MTRLMKLKKMMRRIPVVEIPPSSPASKSLDAGTSHAAVPLEEALAEVVGASMDAFGGVVVSGGGVVPILRRTPSRTSEVFAA